MMFCESMLATEENITNLIETRKDLRKYFNESNLSAKKVQSTELYAKSFYTFKHELNNGAIGFLKNITKPRLVDLATYDPNGKCYEFKDIDITEQFDSAKLHWLVNDVKYYGLGYPPQGYMQKDGFVAHPGTYRFYAAFAHQIKCDVSVWDTYNNLNGKKLDLSGWISFCTNGFIRKDRYITIKLDDIPHGNREAPYRYLEVHETKNHHDHNIFNQDKALAEIYNSSKPTIFCATEKILSKVKASCIDESLYTVKVTQLNPFCIPSVKNFKGVAMWIGEEGLINSPFDLLFLYLDINDDVAYMPDTKLIIFNNSTHNCKKLIPEIVSESADSYLTEFKWASKTSIIPKTIGNSL